MVHGDVRMSCWISSHETAEWTVGDPLDPTTRIGPMIEPPHLDKVLSYLDPGRAEGARVVAGGDRVLDSGGWFVAPTVFDDVRNDMRIARARCRSGYLDHRVRLAR